MSGKVKNVSFVLTDPKDNKSKVHIQTTHEKPHKFLGSQVTKMNTPNDNFKHFREIFEDKLNNIDKSKVHGKFKLSIYERYALPSLRFHLSIHDLYKTYLDQLDKILKKFLKKW